MGRGQEARFCLVGRGKKRAEKVGAALEQKEKMKVTLRRSGEGYFRVSSEGAPLLVEIPCVAIALDASRALFEIVNDETSAQQYKRAFGIDRTLQLALASEEEKYEREATLTPLIQVPSTLPSGPCVGAALLGETRCFRANGANGAKAAKAQKPSACSASEVVQGAKCKVLLDIFGLKRKQATTRWHFDVAVSQILLEPPGAPQASAQCPFSDDDEPLDVESCVQDEESEYVVPDQPELESALESARESARER